MTAGHKIKGLTPTSAQSHEKYETKSQSQFWFVFGFDFDLHFCSRSKHYTKGSNSTVVKALTAGHKIKGLTPNSAQHPKKSEMKSQSWFWLVFNFDFGFHFCSRSKHYIKGSNSTVVKAIDCWSQDQGFDSNQRSESRKIWDEKSMSILICFWFWFWFGFLLSLQSLRFTCRTKVIKFCSS